MKDSSRLSLQVLGVLLFIALVVALAAFQLGLLP